MAFDTNEIDIHWGLELKRFRRRSHLMQDGAARLLGVSQAYISRLEGGFAEPSKRLKSRLEQLMYQPEHWSLIEHIRTLIAHSPYPTALLRQKDGEVIVEAASISMNRFNTAFPHFQTGEALDLDPDLEFSTLLNELILEGCFEGRVALAETLWSSTSDIEGQRHYWRSIQSPLRNNEVGDWLLHTCHVQISSEEKNELEAEWGDNIKFTHFQPNT